MRCWKSTWVLVACLIGAAPACCRAGFVVTEGTEKVIPSVPFAQSFAANWTGVDVAIAGAKVGTKANLTTGTPDGIAPTSNVQFTVPIPFAFAGKYAGAQLGPIPKFRDARTKRRAFSSLTVTAGKKPNTTQAHSESSFTATPSTPDGDVASLSGNANVTGATGKSPPGIALASSADPWFFTVSTSSDLQLTIGLENVSLVASAATNESAFGMIHAFGSFGVDSVSGFQMLASWDFLKEVSGNSSFSLSSMTLVDQISGKPLDKEVFSLSPGVTYQLNADLQLGARVDPVPEPTAAALFGVGTLGLLGSVRRRRRTAVGELAK